MLARIREASEDGLTGRIALALAGASLAFLAAWMAADAAPQVPFQLLLIPLYSRSTRAAAILLSNFYAPVGVVCIALAMPVAAAVRSMKRA